MKFDFISGMIYWFFSGGNIACFLILLFTPNQFTWVSFVNLIIGIGSGYNGWKSIMEHLQYIE